MGLHQDSKIRHLIILSSNYRLLTSSLLEKEGYSRQLRYKYRQNGLLLELARGIYYLAGSKLSWKDIVIALQEQLNLDVHVGASTVFSLKQKTHYLGSGIVYLYCNCHLPKWVYSFREFDNHQFVFLKTNPIPDNALGMMMYEGMRVSSLERAILEQLQLVGRYETFDGSMKLLESLTTLRPKLLQQLLESCSSVKVKRMFFYIAEFLNYRWYRDLILDSIDMGSGSRRIGEGGVFNAKYNIIAPALGEP